MRLIRNIDSNVNPSDDAKLYNKVFSDGLFESVNITSLGSNQVNIPALYGIVQGRDFTTENENINVKLPISSTSTGYVVLRVNLANGANPLTFESYLAPFIPTNEDINSTGNIAEMILATYEATAVSVTSITNSFQLAVSIESPVSQITLQASGWDLANKTYTINDSRITKTPVETKQEFIPMPANVMTDAQFEALRGADIVDYNTLNGSAVIKARGTIPVIDIPIQVIFRGIK